MNISPVASQWSCHQSLVPQQLNIFAPTSSLLSTISKMCFSTTNVCANVREHFPRPNERKRINRHGWNKRMSTPAGRRILMRRILKGRHVLSH